MPWIKIATLVLQYAPTAIDLVERLFSPGENDRKRLSAAKEVTEAVKSVIDEIETYPAFEKIDAELLGRALKDEDRFGEEVAKVNDAIVAFQNYIDSYKED